MYSILGVDVLFVMDCYLQFFPWGEGGCLIQKLHGTECKQTFGQVLFFLG